MLYMAVIGDIVASRSSQERQQLQEHFRAALQAVNDRFAGQMAARFSIYAGDECEALFTDPVAARRAASIIRYRLLPCEITFGLGVGPVNTVIDFDDVGSADGPAFHRARSALNAAKKARIPFCLEAPHPDAALLNTLLDMIAAVEDNLSRRRAEAVRLMDELHNQYAVAEKMGISQATVNGHLANAFYHRTRRALDLFDNHLAQLFAALQ